MSKQLEFISQKLTSLKLPPWKESVLRLLETLVLADQNYRSILKSMEEQSRQALVEKQTS